MLFYRLSEDWYAEMNMYYVLSPQESHAQDSKEPRPESAFSGCFLLDVSLRKWICRGGRGGVTKS